MEASIIVGDTETTGVCREAQMVELGFHEIGEDLSHVRAFESLVDPECHIPFGASAVHHILDKHVENSPTVTELFDIVLKDSDFSEVWLVCHNVSFDVRFLSPFMNITKQICTLRAAKKYYPDAESHKLMALAYELELPLPTTGDAHRALYDVEVTVELLKRILKDTGQTLSELADVLNKPQHITKIPFGKWKGSKLSELPDSYVTWLLKQDTLDSDLRWSLEEMAR
ncbi:MAG: DUF3820 family protein [Spirochaetales bacterium]|jgi:exodeoxyribonuclease X|nr:DUF3820 family protein [Spirochaetales bacterium]